MSKKYYTYIATNIHNTVLYTGATNDLERRMNEHANKLVPGFSARYNVNKLVWFEEFSHPYEAIVAEKRIKGWRREKKLNLIKDFNPSFSDCTGRDSSLCSE